MAWLWGSWAGGAGGCWEKGLRVPWVGWSKARGARRAAAQPCWVLLGGSVTGRTLTQSTSLGVADASPRGSRMSAKESRHRGFPVRGTPGGAGRVFSHSKQ